MKAVYFEEFGHLPDVTTVPDPEVPADGVVIQVKATGLCRSDWHGWMGHDSDVHLPHVPGHELAGVIAAVGTNVHAWQRGDRVTLPFSGGCGHCEQCRSGNQQICDNYFQPGFTAWGSFAEYVAIRYADTNLVHLPEDMGYVEAASLGCRFITSFRAVVTQGQVRGGEWVVVHGCGGVGLSAITIAHALGARVIGVDIADDKLALAQSMGAVHGLNAQKIDDIPEAIKQITGGGAHASIDALGSAETCRNSILCLRKRGRHVQVGLIFDDPPLPMGPVIAKELEIIGSHGMQAHVYPQIFAMIADGRLNPAGMIGKAIALDEAPAALAAMNDFAGTGITVIDRF